MADSPSQNHFELFGIEAESSIDGDDLARRYRDLMRAVHPDRHVAAEPARRLAAARMAARVNEAYLALRAPLARAAYRLSLVGVDALSERNEKPLAPDFLMRQLELREAAEEAAGDGEKIAALRAAAVRDEESARIETESLLAKREWESAADALRRWQYARKFREDLAAAESESP